MPPFETTQLDAPRAVARRQVLSAVRALSGPGNLHDARVALKRARALVALCPPGSDGTDPEDLRKALRKTGKRLAAQRDREAALEVVATIDDRIPLPEEIVDSLTGPTENHLRLRRLLDEVAGELEVLAKKLRRLGRDPSGEQALDGLSRAYRKARKYWGRAEEQATADALHELRKRTKVLRYQMEWFAPVWPQILDAWVRELHTMTDELGQVHDVTVLRHSLATPEAADVRERVAPALRALHHDAQNCRRWSLARGGRLFAEKPKAFRRRMRRIADSAPAPTLLEPGDG